MNTDTRAVAKAYYGFRVGDRVGYEGHDDWRVTGLFPDRGKIGLHRRGDGTAGYVRFVDPMCLRRIYKPIHPLDEGERIVVPHRPLHDILADSPKGGEVKVEVNLDNCSEDIGEFKKYQRNPDLPSNPSLSFHNHKREQYLKRALKAVKKARKAMKQLQKVVEYLHKAMEDQNAKEHKADAGKKI